MNNIYFDNVIEIGKLYLDYVFYEFESEPILFTCIDERKNLYFCLCSDIRFCQKWIITKCNINTLKALIEEEVDIATTFLSSPNVTVINMDLEGTESSSIIRADQIDPLDLPKDGIYIKCDKDKARNYLWNKELAVLSAQLKAIIDVVPIVENVVKSYSAVLNKTVNLLYKQTKMYNDSDGKDFIEELDNKTIEVLDECMIKRYEYSIDTTDKYLKIADNIDSADNENYIHAA